MNRVEQLPTWGKAENNHATFPHANYMKNCQNFSKQRSATISNFNDKSKFLVPRDEIELKLTLIWEEEFKHTDIGLNDNFFDIGGHSLAALNLINKINKVFDIMKALEAFYTTKEQTNSTANMMCA